MLLHTHTHVTHDALLQTPHYMHYAYAHTPHTAICTLHRTHVNHTPHTHLAYTNTPYTHTYTYKHAHTHTPHTSHKHTHHTPTHTHTHTHTHTLPLVCSFKALGNLKDAAVTCPQEKGPQLWLSQTKAGCWSASTLQTSQETQSLGLILSTSQAEGRRVQRGTDSAEAG